MARSNTLPQEGMAIPESPADVQTSHPLPKIKLQDLIPIAMVIVGSCEPCAESTVKRALEQGGSWQDIDMTLQIIANMQRLDCLPRQLEQKLLPAWRSH
jgi:hypothetical protein